MEQVAGKIVDIDQSKICIEVPTSQVNLSNLTKRQYQDVLVGFHDGRGISPEQKRKAWVLISEVAQWQHGFKSKLTLDDTNFDLKREFVMRCHDSFLLPDFSLADCDMTTARAYISFLIEFILQNDIPTKIPLIQACDDIEHYMLACLMHKKCAVCNKAAELHHFNAIGMGRDRREILQIGMLVISLCREHHSTAHTKGKSWLMQSQHLLPLPLTLEIGQIYRLTNKNLDLASARA